MAETPWGLDATESVKLIAMGKIVNILPSIARPTARPASRPQLATQYTATLQHFSN